MKRLPVLIILAALEGMCRLWAAAGSIPPPASGPKVHEPIKPIPLEVTLDPRKVALGRALFHEAKLSHDNTLSCASCHDLAKGGVDHRMHSMGSTVGEGMIKTPTVFNSGGNFKQFWDGRAATLEEQIDGPIQSAQEMHSTWDEVAGKLRAESTYTVLFKAIYPDGIQPNHIRDALAEFERSLTTPNSRFDKFLRGDDAGADRRGKRRLPQVQVLWLHELPSRGECRGQYVRNAGRHGGLFRGPRRRHQSRWRPLQCHETREDRHVFKVPTLRNVALTGLICTTAPRRPSKRRSW